MNAALKALVKKFRASFAHRKENDVLESLPDQPLALPGSIAVPTQASALPISSVVTEKIAHEALGLSSEKASICAQETPSAHLQSDSNSSGSNVVQISTKAVTGVTADLIARCNENARLAKEKAEREVLSSKPLAVPKSNVMRLPVWPEPVRGVPNGMLRSALFGAIKKGPRRYMKGEEIAAQEGIEIRYTGERLDQGDLDLWESILHVARFQEMGSQCRFTAYAMFKLLGKTDSGKNRDTLHRSVLRLKANAVEVDQGRYSYIGGLVDEAYKDKETREYVVIINAKLRPLFATDQFTQIDWNVRHALAGQPLAQWLHGYYASHANPYPVKVETLHKLCGSEAVRMDHFRQDLKKALDALTDASNANDQPFSYEIRSDLVHVEKKPSGTQRQHLLKKTKQVSKGKRKYSA
jgi:TrfA protein